MIGEDDDFISSITAEESWWEGDDDDNDDDNEANGATSRLFGNAGATPNIKVDAKKVVSREIFDVDDNSTLPSLQKKANEMEEDGNTTVHAILNAPPRMRRTIVNDESTISSNITMDTRMDAV